MATEQAISTFLYDTVLALADSPSSDIVTGNLGVSLAALPGLQNLIQALIDGYWPDDSQLIGEKEIVRAIGVLFAAGILYGHLFHEVESPLLIALADTPAGRTLMRKTRIRTSSGSEMIQ